MKTKRFKISFWVLSLSFLVFGQAEAAQVSFSEDTQLNLSGLTTLYVKSGSTADSLNVSGSALTADIPSGSTFTLGAASYNVLSLTPSDASTTLTFDNAYFGSGYVSQWAVGSSVSSAQVSFSVAASETNADYLVKIDGNNLGYYTSNSSGVVSFTYTGGFSNKTFTITRQNRPGAVVSGGGEDVSPPSISNIGVAVSDTSTTISWQTNEASISWLLYGTSTRYGLEATTSAYLTSHSLTLTNLSASTTYHYQIKSKDSAGNIGSYTDRTFTTLAPGEKPKVIEETPKKEAAKPISEMTTAELRVEISRILTLISQFRTQLAEISPAPAGIPAGFTFAKNLSAGMSNPDVAYLKKILDVEVPDHVKWTGNKYFGSKVKAAVVKFQKKYSADISAATGYTIKASGFVGKGTRAKLNQLIK